VTGPAYAQERPDAYDKVNSMSQAQRAMIHGRYVVCPLCGSEHFTAKQFKVETTFLQLMEWEVFGDTGVMLICVRCTRIQHFARHNAVTLSD
jgi:hypothetical protein